ncbi:hypothetical protein KUTeg_022567 [Tegillarca granosa]|uniref:NADAR domain-containing protein n=1 Tax=Tegillarca granosa TaxID=220873 RepID=A0ABQ9ECR2_TEGGR|nr:hypothetical protein KUTeg_022567 [Tegillarca granosa]
MASIIDPSQTITTQPSQDTPRKRGHESSINLSDSEAEGEFREVKKKARKRRDANTSQDKGIHPAPLMFISILITCRDKAKNIFSLMAHSFINNEINQVLQGQQYWLEATPGNRGFIVRTINNQLVNKLISQDYLRNVLIRTKVLKQPKRVFGVVKGIELNETTKSILKYINENTKNLTKPSQALRLNKKDRKNSTAVRIAFDNEELPSFIHGFGFKKPIENHQNKNNSNNKQRAKKQKQTASYSQAVRGTNTNTAPTTSTPKPPNRNKTVSRSQDLFDNSSQDNQNTQVKSQTNEQDQKIKILQEVIYQLLSAVEANNLIQKKEISRIKKIANLRQQSPLSNFFPCQIFYMSILFNSVEHAYQHTKARFHGLHHLAHQIRLAPTAAKAKNLTKFIRISDHWQQNKISILQELLKIKFTHCSAFKEFLLSTQNQNLYHNVSDWFWGTGDEN